MKKLLLFSFMLAITSTLFGQSVWNPAANPTTDSLWTTAANWNPAAVPTETDQVQIGVPDTCFVTGTENVGLSLRLGTDSVAALVLKEGAAITFKGTEGPDWIGFGVDTAAYLRVEADATITAGNHVYFGFGADCDAHIYGTVVGPNNFGLDKRDKGIVCNVTIYGGGLVQARYMSDDSFGPGAHMDLQGGTFKLTEDELATVNTYIEEGKIVAYGGEGMVKVDLVDGATVITSVPPGTTLWSPAEGGSGLWNDAANWSDKRVPLDTNRVLFARANVQECVLDIETTVKRIAVGNGGDGGTLRIKSGGILNLIEVDSWSSVGQTHSGTLILEAGAVINKAENRFDIGNQTGSNGTLTIDGGELNAYDMNVGRTVGATGSITMNSGTITTNTKSLDIGDHGTGTLTMNGGDINIADDIYIAKNSTDSTAGTGTLTMNGGKIYMTEDMKAGNAGLGILTLNDGIIEINDRLYLGEDGGKAEIYLKGGQLIVRDKIQKIEGESFIDITDGTFILDGENQLESNSKITALIADGKIIAGGGLGTVKVVVADGQTILTAELPTAVNDIAVEKASLELKNYPNPVGNKTHISYVLENTENVLLNVYDMSGMLVKTLVSGLQPSGTNIIDYDTSSLNNGVYLLNLRTGSKSVTTKFIK